MLAEFDFLEIQKPYASIKEPEVLNVKWFATEVAPSAIRHRAARAVYRNLLEFFVHLTIGLVTLDAFIVAGKD